MLTFVYGTLRRGNCNNSVLGRASFVGEAVTRKPFHMLDTGGFPVILGPTLDGHPVRGEVYVVDEAILARLDRLEGEGRMYLRTRQYVDLAGGVRPRVHMYVGAPSYWHHQRMAPVKPVRGVYDWYPRGRPAPVVPDSSY